MELIEKSKTMKDKSYDCTTCPYPAYRSSSIIFCDVCMRKVLDTAKEERGKKRKEIDDGS